MIYYYYINLLNICESYNDTVVNIKNITIRKKIFSIFFKKKL